MPNSTWLFALLVPLGSLAAQVKGEGTSAASAASSFSALGAKVMGVRFFPGDSDLMKFDQRYHLTEFDSATVKFISVELDLDYPKTDRRVSFELACEYSGPNRIAGTPVLKATIQAGWDGSYHATGWGAKSRGTWEVGAYRVTCRDGSKVVATGDFRVTRDVFQLPEINGAVTGMRFFEGGSPMPALANRKYQKEFPSATSRRIYLELGVDYPRVAGAKSYEIACSYDFPDNRSFPVQLKTTIQQGWTGSFHAVGLGWDDTSHWVKGDYEVSCRYEGRLIAKSSFTVE